MHSHVSAFAPQHRFSCPILELAWNIEMRLQQVRVAGIKLPQDWQDALVRKQHFPWRLDPNGARRFNKLSEFLPDHPFPRIELENRCQRLFLTIDEGCAIPAYFVNRRNRRGETCL